MIKASAEMTDTFGGEANYCWVRRVSIEANTEAGAIRRVKKELGLNGHRCRKVDFGDSLALYPSGMNVVVFVDLNAGI